MSLYGIYGSHTVEACPVNHLEHAKSLVAFADGNPVATLAKYRIHRVLGQYHSAFEHTFVWIVDAEDAHLIEEFALESGLARFNKLRIVPLHTFSEGVVPRIKKTHGL